MTTDNLELIKELIILEEESPVIFLEMLRKNKESEYGSLVLFYEKGKITAYKSEKCFKKKKKK